MIVTSTPNPFKNPPHYKDIYEAPTQRVLPGLLGSQKISSESIACSFPGIPGSEGLPPVARRIYLAVTVYFYPLTSSNYMLLDVRSEAFLLKYFIFSSFSFFL